MPTPTMPAGTLRQRVAVQTKTEERDASGGVVEAWGTAHTRWAQVEPLSGRELFTAAQVDARVTHRVTLRYLAGLNPTHRLLCGTRVLNILSVLDLEERHTVMQAMCMEDV